MTWSFLWGWSFDRHYYRLRRSFIVLFLWELLSLTCHTIDGRLGFCGEGWLAGSQCLPTHCFRSSAVFLKLFSPVLRIRIFSIPDSNFFHSGSEVFASRIRIKEWMYFNPKKLLLSSRKNDPGCPARIPDLEVKKAPDPGSGSTTL